MLFAISIFVSVFGGIACFIFHDGILPDDQSTEGLAAIWSFSKVFAKFIGISLMLFAIAIGSDYLFRKGQTEQDAAANP